MLGSAHDSEDALQDALLRAWRGLPRFEGRSSLRSWLYTICTNTCLNLIERRPKRVMPLDYSPASTRTTGSGLPPLESIWVEPFPDAGLGLEDGYAAPEARYELRESVELAFVAALQHLPANQRAVLILREVLGFSASEVAESLDTSVASVNSALQRARKTVDERLPDQSQQETLRDARRRGAEAAGRGLHGRDVARRRRGGRRAAVRGRRLVDAAAARLVHRARRAARVHEATGRCRASGAGSTSRPRRTASPPWARTPGTSPTAPTGFRPGRVHAGGRQDQGDHVLHQPLHAFARARTSTTAIPSRRWTTRTSACGPRASDCRR